MSLTIGIYDFFAYTLPGVFYLFIIIYLYKIAGVMRVDFQILNNLSILSVIAITAVAYILGLIIDPVAKRWYRLFRKKNASEVVLDRLKENNPHLEIKFQAQDWPILRAYIRREDNSLVSEIERMNVMRIMLRNISLCLAIFAVIQISQYVIYNFFPLNLVLGVAFVLASIIAGRESAKFADWFHEGFYEAIIAYSLELSDLVVKGEKAIHENNDEAEKHYKKRPD